MTYSVIVLSFNKLEVTRRRLSLLVTETVADEPWELIVIDNGSTDGSQEWCTNELTALGKQHGVPVQVVCFEENQGCCPARNKGISLASGKYVAFCDNDVSPQTRDWLPKLRARLEATPEAGMIGPKMIYPPPSNLIQCAGVGISQRGHVCFYGRGEPQDAPAYNQVREVQCLISACLLLPKTLLDQFGGFDPAFHPVQFEDFDLVYRLREKGYRAIYTPEVEMIHDESVTTQGTATLRNAANVVRNGLLFQKRWRHLFSQETDGPTEEQCRWKKELDRNEKPT